MAFDQNAFDVFGEVIDELENLDQDIQDLATRIVTQMREEAPVDTGDLKRSIKLNLALNPSMHSKEVSLVSDQESSLI